MLLAELLTWSYFSTKRIHECIHEYTHTVFIFDLTVFSVFVSIEIWSTTEFIFKYTTLTLIIIPEHNLHKLTLLSPKAVSIPGTMFRVWGLQWGPRAVARDAVTRMASRARFLLLSFMREHRAVGSSPISPFMNLASDIMLDTFCSASFLTYNMAKKIINTLTKSSIMCYP